MIVYCLNAVFEACASSIEKEWFCKIRCLAYFDVMEWYENKLVFSFFNFFFAAVHFYYAIERWLNLDLTIYHV